MELNSKEYQIYKKINFTNRYEALSNNFQFENTFEGYSNEEVIKIIESLGFKTRYIKNGNFFKIKDRANDLEFYFHLCLKYGNVELIIGATDLSKDLFITGSVFHGLHRDIKYVEGIDLDRFLKGPKFRNYEDLREILKEAFSIYEDFKKALIESEIST